MEALGKQDLIQLVAEDSRESSVSSCLEDAGGLEELTTSEEADAVLWLRGTGFCQPSEFGNGFSQSFPRSPLPG